MQRDEIRQMQKELEQAQHAHQAPEAIMDPFAAQAVGPACNERKGYRRREMKVYAEEVIRQEVSAGEQLEEMHRSRLLSSSSSVRAVRLMAEVCLALKKDS